MIIESIVPQSAGSLSVAVLALIMTILQLVFFFRKRQFTWYGWGAAVSFSSMVYAIGVFLEYNTLGPVNRFGGLLEFTAIICLVHCLYGFTFAYLGMSAKRYHILAGIFNAFILIVLWSTTISLPTRLLPATSSDWPSLLSNRIWDLSDPSLNFMPPCQPLADYIMVEA